MSAGVDDGAESKEKKSLDEQLAEDPYVHLALFLMEGNTITDQTVGAVK